MKHKEQESLTRRDSNNDIESTLNTFQNDEVNNGTLLRKQYAADVKLLVNESERESDSMTYSKYFNKDKAAWNTSMSEVPGYSNGSKRSEISPNDDGTHIPILHWRAAI